MNCLLFTPDELEKGSRLVVRGRRFEQVVTRLKARAGTEVRVGEIGGMLGSGRVLDISATGCTMEVTCTVPPPRPLPLALVTALARPKSMRRIVHAATTLGIKRIWITGAWKSEKSYWQSPLLTDESLERTIRRGLEQGVDTVVPAVEKRKRFKPFVEDELPAIIGAGDAVVAHPRGAAAFPRTLHTPVTLVVGPDGGFTDYELDLLVRHGCRPVTLGARVLRTDEAVVALTGRLTGCLETDG